MNTLWDDVQVVLTREALQAPAAKRPSRHTEWSNAHSFIDGGYLARIEPGLPLEVEEVAVDWCAVCLRDVGFTAERPAQVGFVHRGQG